MSAQLISNFETCPDCGAAVTDIVVTQDPVETGQSHTYATYSPGPKRAHCVPCGHALNAYRLRPAVSSTPERKPR